MARVLCLAAVLLSASAERWSRQISSYTSDISDWVPLPGPVQREPEPIATPTKRQAVAEPRILSEPFPGFSRPTGFADFPSRTYYNSPANRQLYLQSVPSAPQNYLMDQGFGQNFRFGLSQPNFPLNQAFVSPQLSFDAPPPLPKQRPQQAPGQIKFDSFPKPPPGPPKSYANQPKKPEPQKSPLVDGYRLESNFDVKKKPQSLQKLKYENFEKPPKPEPFPSSKPKVEREEVQLLYVPLDSLNRGQFNFRNPGSSHLLTPEVYPGVSRPKSNFGDFQRPIMKPTDFISSSQDLYHDKYLNLNAPFKPLDQEPKYSTISSPFPTVPPTTPKPKKLKPHQPPLAIFMTVDSKRSTQIKVGDVLSSLKNANTIAVLDSVNPSNAPKVFIGPSSLSPPNNYVRFELPYLSNIDHSDKKLRQMPFFVAPLSYNTPQGFAKIPFPSPHVGSVVINAQIKDSQVPIDSSNFPATLPPYRQETKQTTKPNFSFFSTSAPKTNAPANFNSNYYSIEPQTVSTVKPREPEPTIITAPPKTGSYFIKQNNQYDTNYANFPVDTYKVAEPVKSYKPEVSTQRTTVPTSTTKPPSTYPSQLLETHNPYSINQAFHFSTPLDYHSYLDENYATPGFKGQSSLPSSIPTSSSPQTLKPQEVVTEKQNYQSSPNYVQSYSPEIHYESEHSRYPTYSTDYATKDVSSDYTSSIDPNTQTVQSDEKLTYQPEIKQTYQPDTKQTYQPEYTVDTQAPVENYTQSFNPQETPYYDNLSTKTPEYYNQYETGFEQEEKRTTPSTTTTSTTRRTPIRSRGRPRSTTSRPESGEATTRASVTRRPLRERKPLPTRPRYEPNKITTERATRKPLDSSEVTPKFQTKQQGSRTRGRIHYKPQDNEELYEKRGKHSSKEADLAYQRDVLHQNYPVTLMERTSTVDIEAITEPTPRASFTKNDYDTENAYSQQIPNREEVAQTFGNDYPTETTYVPKLPSTRNEEYYFSSRSSPLPSEVTQKAETNSPTTPVAETERPEVISYATESVGSGTEQSVSSYSLNSEYIASKDETTTFEPISKVSDEVSQEKEENVVQTTPSYNRVRVRPGVIRQYHQASTTESSRTKSDRKRAQAVTYRPAFDKRRTTMRIDEIEADLKTKPVHNRGEQEHRHPVYKPDPTTEAPVTSSQEGTTKRGQFRRRRPSYSTTSTEPSATRKASFEVKNRFRGRRPTTEQSVEKSEATTGASTSTVRTVAFNRYHRPKLSERYNKKTETEESEDQDSNYSIHRPKYAVPEGDQWSPKISSDSFKPYNPNDVVDDKKVATTERRSDREEFIEPEIITARNEYDDILLTVTPATNTRSNKKIPDIPPTLEALVEQSKISKSDSPDTMSTFETMLEQVMKSLEEQDEDEYTRNVMKHKGGEIGEIPPERIISSGETQRPTTFSQTEATTVEPSASDSEIDEQEVPKTKEGRRGFWKKVKVRPVTTESIEVAESQYYSNTVNHLGVAVDTKTSHEKPTKKISPTTYKPALSFISDLFNEANEPTVTGKVASESKSESVIEEEKVTEASVSPGDLDLGTGTPDPTLADIMYSSTPTEPTSSEASSMTDRSDGYSFIDYLFGITSSENVKESKGESNSTEKPLESFSDDAKAKIVTTESTFVPDEITIASVDEDVELGSTVFTEIKKLVESPEESHTEISVSREESSSISSLADPENVVSTSMSTEVSHETEICFRGKCIKTNKDIL